MPAARSSLTYSGLTPTAAQPCNSFAEASRRPLARMPRTYSGVTPTATRPCASLAEEITKPAARMSRTYLGVTPTAAMPRTSSAEAIAKPAARMLRMYSEVTPTATRVEAALGLFTASPALRMSAMNSGVTPTAAMLFASSYEPTSRPAARIPWTYPGVAPTAYMPATLEMSISGNTDRISRMSAVDTPCDRSSISSSTVSRMRPWAMASVEFGTSAVPLSSSASGLLATVASAATGSPVTLGESVTLASPVASRHWLAWADWTHAGRAFVTVVGLVAMVVAARTVGTWAFSATCGLAIAVSDGPAKASARPRSSASAVTPRTGLLEGAGPPTTRRMRWSSEPPRAETASASVSPRSSSSRVRARAYWSGSPHTPTARSSQHSSRSIRTWREIHHTAGW